MRARSPFYSIPVLLALAAGAPLATQRPAVEARYHTARQVEELLERLASRHRGFAKLHRTGKSYEGRDLLALEVTDFSTGDAGQKPGILVAAGLQGDEAGASEVALRMLARLLEERATAPTAELLRTRTFYFLPRLNPDAIERWVGKVPVPQRDTLQPLDDDNDEAEDEDGPQDVDGD